MGTRTIRLTLYGFILGLALCVNFIGIGYAITVLHDNKFLDLLSRHVDDNFILMVNQPLVDQVVRFGIVAVIVALLTWIWTSVLLAWNDKPNSKNGLAISLTHFISFIVMSVVWLAIAIMHLTETTYRCHAPTVVGPVSVQEEYEITLVKEIISEWCGLASSIGVISLAISIFCAATALVILLTTRKVGGLYAKLVAPDGETQLYEMKHATRVRTALYSVILVLGLAMNIVTPLSIVTMATNLIFEEDQLLNMGADFAFMGIALVCSLFTWIWASVLLSYHRRISSTKTITRASAHCISTMVLGTVWFVLGVIILRLAGGECPPETEDFTGRWYSCRHNIPVGVLAICLSIILDSVSLFIRVQIKNRGGSLRKSHVAQFDGEATLAELQPHIDHSNLVYNVQPPVFHTVSTLPACNACHHCCHHSHGHCGTPAHTQA